MFVVGFAPNIIPFKYMYMIETCNRIGHPYLNLQQSTYSVVTLMLTSACKVINVLSKTIFVFRNLTRGTYLWHKVEGAKSNPFLKSVPLWSPPNATTKIHLKPFECFWCKATSWLKHEEINVWIGYDQILKQGGNFAFKIEEDTMKTRGYVHISLHFLLFTSGGWALL